MARIVVSVAHEGGLEIPGHLAGAPIRVRSDRWVEDDIIVKFGLNVKRKRLSRKEFRHVRRAAAQNRQEGLA